jgi:ribosome-associated translation inhibitor RaiA
MQTDLQIVFHGVESSPAVESYARKRAEKLERRCPQLTGCRVLIGAPHHSQHHGGHYVVRIELSLPSRELVVTRDPAGHADREDLYACIDAAFDDAKRLLDDHAGRRVARRKESSRERRPHRL